jgi:hypothetical protein
MRLQRRMYSRFCLSRVAARSIRFSKSVASIASGHSPVAFGKVALKIAAIVKDAGHLNHAIFAAAIEKEMSWLLHAFCRLLDSG